MKQFGLIGYPLKNTFSKDFFRKKFAGLHLTDYSYENYPLGHIRELQQLITDNHSLYGLNVTIPFKQSLIPLLHELDETAASCGAVNCIKINRNGTTFQLAGYNTDMHGFEISFRNFIAEAPGQKKMRALVLGTGGASAAVRAVLSKNGFSYTVVSRNLKGGEITYADLNKDVLSAHTVIINTTPLGMFPNTDAAPPIPYECIGRQHYCYDLIYLPHETLFMQQCAAQGAQVKNGMEMLHLQAEKSWEIWQS